MTTCFQRQAIVATGIAITLACVIGAGSAETGDAVVVIFNKRMEESRRVAEHYAAKRNVPAAQILGLNLSRLETMSRDEFNNTLRDPLWAFLQKEKLIAVKEEKNDKEKVRRVTEARVRYLVLCYGVPARILGDPTIKEPAEERLAKELRRNEASVDSDLALLPSRERNLPIIGPLQNIFYGQTNSNFLHPTNGIFLVGRLDGPTEEIAKGLVDKAIRAEEDGLWGRAYFDLRGVADGEYKLGDDWFRNGSQVCTRVGFETIVDDQSATFPVSFPMSQIAVYGGWYDHHVSGPFTRKEVEFMPGAVAYHLHSYSAHEIRNAQKHWVGPLLAKGATATLGSVDEPYLGGTPDFGAFCGLFIGLGFSFGEAAFASQSALSWQTVAIGDPLYRPFAKKPREHHMMLEKKSSPLLEWSHLKVVNLNIVSGLKAPDMIPYLEEIPTAARGAILTEKLGELYLEKGDPRKGAEILTRALDLNPSPQQRLRILLRIAHLQEREQPQAAYDTFERLLKADPDYPDQASIHRAMLALAQKLNLTEAIQRHERELKR